MPRVAANSSDGSNRECPECHVILARRGDLSRHLRIHLDPATKDLLSYKCPYDGCNFANLQKSNVNTHLRTQRNDSTNEKSIVCPDFDICGFATSDPATLTRHRKRRHDYIPRPRKRREVASQSTLTPSGSESPTEGPLTIPEISANAGSIAADAPENVDPSAAPTFTTFGPLVFPVFTPATVPFNLDIYPLSEPTVPCEKSSRICDFVNTPCVDGIFWGSLTCSLEPKMLYPAYESVLSSHNTPAQISSKPVHDLVIILAPTASTLTGKLDMPELHTPALASIIVVAYFWLLKGILLTSLHLFGLITMHIESSVNEYHGFLNDNHGATSASIDAGEHDAFDTPDAVVHQLFLLTDDREHDVGV
ncbi:hypothetical protein J3R30DRAFT_3406152 [Lentinula aciculospora]|uniref:C2H2-type domain-containing protein n=1 Tax=Lentinula aciculospora TaxID=153920 RepID=A0A9W9A6W6_9AGAR|nr:hypothetical protein J3R30DRAFT_3406152 [Lentinula aciculospora]